MSTMDTSCDIVIVGAGSAGCTLAARLSEDPNLKVTLIEAGTPSKYPWLSIPIGYFKTVGNPAHDWQFETEPEAGMADRRLPWPRGKGPGGSSLINGMLYLRGHQQDYDRWQALGNPGWSWADVLPYFRKAEHNERLSDDWHGQNGPLNVAELQSPNVFSKRFVEAGVQAGWAHNPDFNGARQDGVGLYQVTHKNGERWSAAKGYLTPHRHRSNLTVITQAHTHKVLLDSSHGDPRATGVQYEHKGKMHELRARREVLVSSGAFGSPQLLMLSGIGPAEHLRHHGIPVRHALPGVGQNLQDHITTVLIYRTQHQRETLGFYLSGHPIESYREMIDQICSGRMGELIRQYAQQSFFDFLIP